MSSTIETSCPIILVIRRAVTRFPVTGLMLFYSDYSQGQIQDFFLGGGALVSCATSTPINHIVFHFLQNTSCIRKPQVISSGGVHTPCTLPLDPPLIVISIKFLFVISILCKTEWSWELRTWSHKMNLLDILSTSPHYFCRKWIGTTNENSDFDLRV